MVVLPPCKYPLFITTKSSLPILTIKRENASRKQDGSIGFFDDLRKNIIWQYAATRGEIWLEHSKLVTMHSCNK